MVMNTTTWSPDTCDCIVEYNWDSETTNENRVHTLNRIVRKCTAHSTLNDIQTYNALTEENPRKNKSFLEILNNAPSGLYDIDVNNPDVRHFKKGINLRCEWSGTAPNRVLHIYIEGYTLTQPQKNIIQNFLDTRFGTGKVLLM